MTQIDADTLYRFVNESNRIENIQGVRDLDFQASEKFMCTEDPHIGSMVEMTLDFTGGVGKLRDLPGRNVVVGSSVPPSGGPRVYEHLKGILGRLRDSTESSFDLHVDYEHLHPFMDGNGRSGRMLWLWKIYNNPRPNEKWVRNFIDDTPQNFLQAFYYQMLGSGYKRPLSS